MCLGRHVVPDLTTWARRRWSYAQRVQAMAVEVSSIAKALLLMAHLTSQDLNEIRSADATSPCLAINASRSTMACSSKRRKSR